MWGMVTAVGEAKVLEGECSNSNRRGPGVEGERLLSLNTLRAHSLFRESFLPNIFTLY